MKKIFNNAKMLIGLSAVLTLSSVGLIARSQSIAPTPTTPIGSFDYCKLGNGNPSQNPPSHGTGWKYNIQTDYEKFRTCGGWNGTEIPQNCFFKCEGGYKCDADQNYHGCVKKCNATQHPEGDSCVDNKCADMDLDFWNFVRNNDNLPSENGADWDYAAPGSQDAENACTYRCKDGYEWNEIGCEEVKVDTSCFFCQFKNIALLTLDKWNDIMDKLDTVFKFNGDNVTVVQETIPSGAIMAFDGRKTDGRCPDGWTRFGEADNRFLMGAQSGFGSTGGKSTIKLEANQLPAHQHVYKDTVFSESKHAKMTNGGYSSFDYLDLGKTDIPGNTEDNPKNKIHGNGEGNDLDNFPIFGYRATLSNIYTGKDPTKLLKLSDATDNSVNQSNVTITNPYITVLYCVKN